MVAYVKSANFVFLMLFFTIAPLIASSIEDNENQKSASHEKSLSTKNQEKHVAERATAKELIARKKKKAAARNLDKGEFTATRPKITKINLRNRFKPELISGLDWKNNLKLRELQEKIEGFRSRMNAGPTLQARLDSLPDHQNWLEKIREKEKEIKQKFEAKHQEIESKLKMAHIKLPLIKELKQNKGETILSSRNAFDRHTEVPENRTHALKKKPNIGKHTGVHSQSIISNKNASSEKPVIILDHRNGESKIKPSTAEDNVIEKIEKADSTTSKFEKVMEKS